MLSAKDFLIGLRSLCQDNYYGNAPDGRCENCPLSSMVPQLYCDDLLVEKPSFCIKAVQKYIKEKNIAILDRKESSSMISAKDFLEGVKDLCMNTPCADCPFNVCMPEISCDRILTTDINYSIGVIEKYLEEKEVKSESGKG